MNYKFCPKCGVKNQGYNFCPGCGAPFETGNANLINNVNLDQLNPDSIWDRLEMCQVTVPSGFNVHGVGPDFWDDDIDPLSPEMTLLQSNLFFRKGEIEIMKSNPKHENYRNFEIAQITETSLYFGDMMNGLPHGYGFIFYKINHDDDPDDYLNEKIRNLRNIECNQYFDNFDLILEYCGQFKNGLKDGGGVLYNTAYATISYNGRFVNGIYHGHGTIYLSGKAQENGEFRNGQIFEKVSGKDQYGNYISYLDDDEDEV